MRKPLRQRAQRADGNIVGARVVGLHAAVFRHIVRRARAVQLKHHGTVPRGEQAALLAAFADGSGLAVVFCLWAAVFQVSGCVCGLEPVRRRAAKLAVIIRTGLHRFTALLGIFHLGVRIGQRIAGRRHRKHRLILLCGRRGRCSVVCFLLHRRSRDRYRRRECDDRRAGRHRHPPPPCAPLFCLRLFRRLFCAHRRHHALREACRYVLVLQLAEGGVQGRQLTEQPSAFLAFAHMSEHLRTLLLRQLSVNKGREQRRKFFTFLHIAFLSPPTV